MAAVQLAPDDVMPRTKEVVSEYYFHQCLRKRGHGPHGAYCKQHARKLGHDA